MSGIIRLEENALYPGPVESFEIGSPDGADSRDFKDRCSSHQYFQRKFMQRFSALDHVERSVDVSAGVRTHRDGRHGDDVSFVS